MVFGWSDRRADPAAREAALAARNTATQEFLALDDEQRVTADAVAAADELAGGTRWSRSWQRVTALCDRATEAYLGATREYPLDETRSSPRAAIAEDERATAEIRKARDAVRRFRASHARALDDATAAVASLPRLADQALVAVASARDAIARAEAGGFRSRRALETLGDAERTAAILGGGAGFGGNAGLGELRRAAQRTIDQARAAAALAEAAPETAARVRSALASVDTRLAAAVTKADRISPALSTLRREFSEPCSRDLTGAEDAVRDALAAARRAITAARVHAGAGEWDDAAEDVTATRAALSAAEERHDAVTGRLTELREVRDDPSARASRTRFVLRDAQRLVVDLGLTPEFAPVLDAQSVRLEGAQQRLTGTHPDYLAFLTELRSVEERVGEVVARARARATR